MSLYTIKIDIDEESIKRQIEKIIDNIIDEQIRRKYSESGKEISLSIKELVYSRKDEIIEMVVERSSKEIVRKGIPKFLDSLKK